MVKDALRGYVTLAEGLTEVTTSRARSAARTLVEQGGATASQVTALAEDLVSTSRRNREGIVQIVRHEVEQTLRRLGLGAAGDVDALTQRVRRLEQALREMERRSGSPAPATAPATAPAKKSAPRRKPAAKQTASKTSTPKKTTSRKSAAKKTTTRSSAATTAAARSTTTRSAKRSAAKRSAAKKSSATKASSRRGARRS